MGNSKPPSGNRTVAVADSSPVFRLGMAQLVNQSSTYQWAGEADHHEALMEMLGRFKPDLVVIDFLGNGFSMESIRLGKQISPATHFMAMTEAGTANGIFRALRLGLLGYIKKDCDVREVLEALQVVGEGNRFYCGQILDVLKREGFPLGELDGGEMGCDGVVLTDREVEVLALIAEGHTNLAIAKRLFLSVHTVHTHRKNIMHKLGVRNTAAAVMYAVRSGIVGPNHFLFQG